MSVSPLIAAALVASASFAGAGDAPPPKPRVPPGPQISDPAKVDADFAAIGEYLGERPASGDAKRPARVGVQVVAYGAGAFRAIVLPGGLPGEGWEGGERIVVPGTRGDDGAIRFAGEGYAGELTAGKLALTAPDQAAWALTRVERRSPTLGAQPPEGAVVLCGGESGTSAFGTKIRDGTIGCGGDTRDTYGSFTLHMEFRLPYQPGQPESTRDTDMAMIADPLPKQRWGTAWGIVQIDGGFGLPCTDSRIGGIKGIAPARLNMSYPPLAWQTFDMDFTVGDPAATPPRNPRLTVRHNGVTVHEDVELVRPPRRPEPPPAHVRLHIAAHGLECRFRNIWLVRRGAPPATTGTGG